MYLYVNDDRDRRIIKSVSHCVTTYIETLGHYVIMLFDTWILGGTWLVEITQMANCGERIEDQRINISEDQQAGDQWRKAYSVRWPH